jgi:hypothetical protein
MINHSASNCSRLPSDWYSLSATANGTSDALLVEGLSPWGSSRGLRPLRPRHRGSAPRRNIRPGSAHSAGRRNRNPQAR